MIDLVMDCARQGPVPQIKFLLTALADVQIATLQANLHAFAAVTALLMSQYKQLQSNRVARTNADYKKEHGRALGQFDPPVLEARWCKGHFLGPMLILQYDIVWKLQSWTCNHFGTGSKSHYIR